MTASADDYGGLLSKLLPSGRAWPRALGSRLERLLAGLGEELARADERVRTLLRESDPRTATELLPEWERSVGLPDPCSGPIEGLAGRRGAVVARLLPIGGPTPQFYRDLALALGFSVTIVEFVPAVCGSRLPARLAQPTRPARAGVARCGDRLEPLPGWPFAWRVDADDFTLKRARAGSAVCGDRLSTFGNLVLECTLARAKPAHTVLSFRYATTIRVRDAAAASADAPAPFAFELGSEDDDE